MILAKQIEDADIFTALFSRGVHYVQGDYLQPASPGLDYSFEAEQTLASDEPLAPSWRVAG
jgi:EAL domain-containing protein (putative c-di-GMP-specific phosphodiesterase class I)